MNQWKVATLLLVASVFVLGGCASSSNSAEDDETQRSGYDNPAEEQVTRWLDLQRSGEQAGSQPYSGGDEMVRTYDRYLESFTHPIPEEFEFED